MLKIAYFTDILCIWAYVHDIRMRKLLAEFAGRIEVSYHFLSLFAAVHAKIHTGWDQRGGWSGYHAHVAEVASRFEHVQVHPELWLKAQPHSSLNPHLFIKALQILETREQLSRAPQQDGRTPVEAAIWALRLAFFKQAADIAQMAVLQELAQQLGLPWAEIKALMDSGEAQASLFLDFQLQDEYRVKGSPTLVFNQGRQMLYGNVGYRVIEANIAELLNTPAEQASWC